MVEEVNRPIIRDPENWESTVKQWQTRYAEQERKVLTKLKVQNVEEAVRVEKSRIEGRAERLGKPLEKRAKVLEVSPEVKETEERVKAEIEKTNELMKKLIKERGIGG